MSDEFDPYHRWLGIAPEYRPPDHYQLLGIPRFESDREVIASAADRQMVHVRSFQSGKHAVHTQRILNELAAARVCLLSAEQKAQYDERLRQTAESPVAPPSVTSFAIRTDVSSRRRSGNLGRPMSLVGLGVFAGIVAGVSATVIAIASLNKREGSLAIVLPSPEREQVTVLIDGTPRPVPAEGRIVYRLPQGDHDVQVQRPAHAAYEENVEVESGKRTDVKVQWRPLARMSIELMGRRPDDLELTIDGQSYEWPASRTLVVPCEPGAHQIVAVSSRGRFEKSVVVLPNQTFRVPLSILAESRLTGHWIGSIDVDQAAVDRKLEQAKANPLVRAFLQQSIEPLKAGQLDLNFNSDGSYQLRVDLGPFSSRTSGQWSITQESGSRMTVEMVPSSGPNEYRPIRFEGNDVFVCDLPNELAGLGQFRCRRKAEQAD